MDELNTMDVNAEMMEEANRIIALFKQRVDPDNIMAKMDFSLVEADAVKKEIRLRFPVAKWQLNPNQALHGGLLATSFDIAFGMLVRLLTHHDFIATIDLSVQFLKPVFAGEEVIVAAKANHIGKTIVQLSAEAFVNDVLVGTSRASFIQMKKEK